MYDNIYDVIPSARRRTFLARQLGCEEDVRFIAKTYANTDRGNKRAEKEKDIAERVPMIFTRTQFVTALHLNPDNAKQIDGYIPTPIHIVLTIPVNSVPLRTYLNSKQAHGNMRQLTRLAKDLVLALETIDDHGYFHTNFSVNDNIRVDLTPDVDGYVRLYLEDYGSLACLENVCATGQTTVRPRNRIGQSEPGICFDENGECSTIRDSKAWTMWVLGHTLCRIVGLNCDCPLEKHLHSGCDHCKIKCDPSICVGGNDCVNASKGRIPSSARELISWCSATKAGNRPKSLQQVLRSQWMRSCGDVRMDQVKAMLCAIRCRIGEGMYKQYKNCITIMRDSTCFGKWFSKHDRCVNLVTSWIEPRDNTFARSGWLKIPLPIWKQLCDSFNSPLQPCMDWCIDDGYPCQFDAISDNGHRVLSLARACVSPPGSMAGPCNSLTLSTQVWEQLLTGCLETPQHSMKSTQPLHEVAVK